MQNEDVLKKALWPVKKSNLLLRSAFCVLTSALLLSNGCQALGALVHLVTGDPPIAAQYEPPKGSTLVLVENYRSPDEMQLDGDQIAHEVTDELKKEGKIDTIDPDKLVPLREEDATKYREMNIQAVGRALNAKQVIYVDLLESDVSKDPSAGAVHAIATARIKVIDVKTGNTLWPVDSAHGKELSESIDYEQGEGSRAVSMHTEMLAKLSSKVAKLFYTWHPDNQAEEDAGG